MASTHASGDQILGNLLMSKIRMVCPECGDKENVVKDAYASWNIDTQEWVLHSTYESFDCKACGAEEIEPIKEDIEECPS